MSARAEKFAGSRDARDIYVDLADTVILAVGGDRAHRLLALRDDDAADGRQLRTARRAVDVALILGVAAATRNIFDDFQNDLGTNRCPSQAK